MPSDNVEGGIRGTVDAVEPESEASARARLARIIDAAPAGIILVDPGGNIVLANATAEAQFGYAQEELIGKSAVLLLPERLRSRYNRLRARLIRDPTARPMAAEPDLFGRRKDGSEMAIEVALSLVDLPGSGRCVLSAITDVTERRSEEAQTFGANATAGLAASLDYLPMLTAVTGLAVPQMADWCAVDLLDADGTLRNVALCHTDQAKVAWAKELATRYPPRLDARIGLPDVLRTGKPAISEVSEPLLARAAVDEEHLRILRTVGIRSYMIVPLVANGETLGAITFLAAESGRTFGSTELAAARQLGERAALAVQNARLLAAERRAKEWVMRLQGMMAALADALSREEVATVTVEQGLAALGAASEGLWLLDESARALDLYRGKGFAAAAESRFRRIPLPPGMPLPLVDAVQTGQPVWLESFDDLQRRYPELARTTGFRPGAVACLPLVADERILGALSFTFPESRGFAAEERRSLRTMAQLCAHALDRCRLFEEMERARAEAERAVRARQDILAIVSHDLRNPLAAVAMKAGLIGRMVAGDDRNGERVTRQIDGIIEAVQQMNRMVDDLLDLAKVEAGQLFVIEPKWRDASELALQAVRLLEPLASARHLELATELAFNRLSVRCDGDRIAQVFSNLIGNAIKFTREGGRIVVRGRRRPGEVVFSIIDTGEGIAEDQLPNIFDPYWQAKAGRVGIGLGLSVAKAIVEAHGGRIWVDSRVGHGSTFAFALPVGEGETKVDQTPRPELGAPAEEPR